jgi:transcriptional regulator with XRE-family HTH domain
MLGKKEEQKIHRIIGQNVQKQRQLKKMSQFELAMQIGHSSVGVVSAAEIGIANKHFNIIHLVKISKVLEVDIELFFEGVGEFVFSKD